MLFGPFQYPRNLHRIPGLALPRRMFLTVQLVGDVGHVRQTIVPQNVGEVPGFVDDLLRVAVAQELPKPLHGICVKL